MQGTRPGNWRATRGLFQARGSRQAITSAPGFPWFEWGKGEWAEIRPVVFPRPCRCQQPGKGGACAAAFLGDFGLRRCAVEASCNFFRIFKWHLPFKSFVACLHCMKSKITFRGPSHGRFPSSFLLPQNLSLATSLFSSAHATPARPAIITAVSHLRSSRHRHPPHKEIGVPILESFIVSFVYGGNGALAGRG